MNDLEILQLQEKQNIAIWKSTNDEKYRQEALRLAKLIDTEILRRLKR